MLRAHTTQAFTLRNDVTSVLAYWPAHTGGVHVAAGDLTGDSIAEIITGAGPGGLPHVKAYQHTAGVLTELASFVAYSPAHKGGVDVAAGDLTGDGIAEIITGAGPGGLAHVKAYQLTDGVAYERAGFVAYWPAHTGGVHVAAGDVTGDGIAEIVTGAGPGGLANVRAYQHDTGFLTEVASFVADWPRHSGVVNIADAQMDPPGPADVSASAGGCSCWRDQRTRCTEERGHSSAPRRGTDRRRVLPLRYWWRYHRVAGGGPAGAEAGERRD